MAENPDRKNINPDVFIAAEGDLRFVEREVEMTGVESKVMKTLRILQRYEWSIELKDFGWFDVPLEKE